MTKCADCGSENRDNAKFCDTCGAKLGLAIAEPEPMAPPEGPEDQVFDAPLEEDQGVADPEAVEGAEVSNLSAEVEPEAVEAEPEGEAAADSTEAEPAIAEEVPEDVPEEAAEEPPKTGYLVFPDSSEQPIPPSQWLIGRADLAKFLPDSKKANEISRGHLTVFQEGDRFFVEDGVTMVQRKPSANKTWLVRDGSRTLITGTGRTELQDADEIDVAELVKLQFVMR